ncbi:MAG TPA: MoaD/ThiS family protein [Bacteroidetes bacterium]|nr:MoaD/ThiS family protein [Bacteroidota bacterium]
MEVNVLLFGSLRERLGFTEKMLVFSDTQTLKDWLETEHSDLAQMNYLIAVNQELIRENQVLNAGDEVAVMPPFAGG